MPWRMQFWWFLIRGLRRTKWWHIVLFMFAHFLTSWLFIYPIEPDAEYTQPAVFWYFYMITAYTIGYGDFYPEAFGARMVVTWYVAPLGIVIMGIVVGKLTAILLNILDMARRGLMPLNISGHILVIGDGTARTVAALENLLGDSSEHRDSIALLGRREENPLPDKLEHFVSGKIDDLRAQANICVAEASTVVILADDDMTALGQAMTVARLNSHATIAVHFDNYEVLGSLQQLDPTIRERIRPVISTDMSVLVQEALDPGAYQFVSLLMNNNVGEVYLRLPVPDGVNAPFDVLSLWLMRQRINVMGLFDQVELIICPDPNQRVQSGDVLAVAADGRSKIADLNWTELQPLLEAVD